jgi:hypothetical protein
VKNDLLIPGINIQWPWSRLILEGKKTVETRSYPIPKKHIGKPLALIETPGPRGKREAGIESAKIIGIVVFGGSYKYRNRSEWKNEESKHRVAEDDAQFTFNLKKEKWAWPVLKARSLADPVPPPNSRGIVFASNCIIPG